MKDKTIIYLNGKILSFVEGTIYGLSNIKEKDQKIIENNHSLVKPIIMEYFHYYANMSCYNANKDIVDINYIIINEYSAKIIVIKREGKSTEFICKFDTCNYASKAKGEIIESVR